MDFSIAQSQPLYFTTSQPHNLTTSLALNLDCIETTKMNEK